MKVGFNGVYLSDIILMNFVYVCLNISVSLVPKFKIPVPFSIAVSFQDLAGPSKRPSPEVIKLFSCSAQLRLKFILLINVKIPAIVGILTFNSRINFWLW